MLEQIRKYMTIPNVLILMAIKLEQIFDIVEQEFHKSLSIMLKDHRYENNDLRKRAIEYVEKLIPVDKTIHLPDLKINAKECYLFYCHYNENKFHCNEEKKKCKENPNGEDCSKNNKDGKLYIENRILSLTYKKFGIIFTIPKNGVHYLVPNTLRQLHNYISFTKNMDSFANLEEEQQRTRVAEFKEYFLKYWVNNNIFSEKYRELIRKFYRENRDLKNKSLLLSYINKDNDKKNQRINQIFDNILDKNNLPENISLGDVLFCLNDRKRKIKSDFNKEEERKFIFCIKTIYSILLHEAINIDKDPDNDPDNTTPILGGNIVNRETRKSIPTQEFDTEGKRNKDRNNFSFNYEDQCKKTKYDLDLICVDNDNSISEIRAFKWLQFFIYLGGSHVQNYRKDDVIYYNKQKKYDNFRHVFFSVWAFTFYLLNPSKISKRLLEVNSKENPIEKALCVEIEEWRNEYKSIFPYSIDFFEDLFIYVKDEVKKN